MKRRVLARTLLCSAFLFGMLAASEPPDSEVNPITGSIESVDAVLDGGDLDIRHVIDSGQGAPKIQTILSDAVDDDQRPRISIRPDGKPAVVWWSDGATDSVLFRTRDLGLAAWDTTGTLSSPGEDSRNPEIVNDGSAFWVAFEIDTGSGDRDLAVNIIGEGPDPIPTKQIVGTTDYVGALDIQPHYDSGNLWTTWIQDGADLGWSEYDYTSQTWSVPFYERYADDSVEDARARIRATVLAN